VAKAEKKEEEFDESAFEDEKPYDTDARRRSHANWLYRRFFMLVINPWFNCFIFLMIILNTLSLAADDYPGSNKKDTVIAVCNQIFTWTFVFEMLCKLIGLGPNNYRKDPYNVFDFVIVCISLLDWSTTIALHGNTGSAGNILQALRACRLLRIIKLARHWTALQDILAKIYKSLGELAIFLCLLTLFMYIFALLGMQFFSHRAYFDLDGKVVPYVDVMSRFDSGEILTPPRTNFNTIYFALTTCFVVIFAEDWCWKMYHNIVPFGVHMHYYSIFFVILYAFGGYVLFALFAAILLSHFDDDGVDDDEEEVEAYIEEFESERSFWQRLFSHETAESIRAGFVDMFGRKLRGKQTEPEDDQEPPVVPFEETQRQLNSLKDLQVSARHTSQSQSSKV
jgi:hypothetical protein